MSLFLSILFFVTFEILYSVELSMKQNVLLPQGLAPPRQRSDCKPRKKGSRYTIEPEINEILTNKQQINACKACFGGHFNYTQHRSNGNW